MSANANRRHYFFGGKPVRASSSHAHTKDGLTQEGRLALSGCNGASRSKPLKRDELGTNPSRFSLLLAHDLFGKPLYTFPDHALPGCTEQTAPAKQRQPRLAAGAEGLIANFEALCVFNVVTFV